MLEPVSEFGEAGEFVHCEQPLDPSLQGGFGIFRKVISIPVVEVVQQYLHFFMSYSSDHFFQLSVYFSYSQIRNKDIS